ncbi:hypothetical protein [Nocardioides massiliensis]|uniref:Uncharacterized protein n=1 Tax=Nocardioides massiliensis TaxID=1325935 RepID=A0ABT9NJP3_9ACTN|nr:hypothetical protein [Nocardioides massiliensis]MDP9820628.1 hypothetical protein [Nocardioides massiliensis]
MTTQIQPTASGPVGPVHAMPQASSRQMPAGGGVAPLRDNGYRMLQVVLFVAGAVLLPLGLVVIVLGWYGAANTPYEYDQISYLVSGGLLGLGLTFCGGFLYFGAWLARLAADQKEASKRLADTLLVLADVTSRSAAGAAAPVAPAATRDPGSVPVVAGSGTTVHRADCSLIQHRDDLRPAGPDAPGMTQCRLCKPDLV